LAGLLANPIQAEDRDIDDKLLADLGAILETRTVHPVDGITAAGQPNEAAFEVFAANAYVRVIDLRGVSENRGMNEREVVETLGMDYVPFPITSAQEISFESAAKLDQLIKDADGPVLVHCASSDRVGALLALRSSLGGAGDESAIAYGIQAGLTSLVGAVAAALAND
jgi:uncharacterized protein (TIGR01244 family)